MTAFLVEAVARTSILVLAGLLAASLPGARSAALRHWMLAAAVICAWATLPLSLAMPAGWRTPIGSQYAAVPAAGLGEHRHTALPSVDVTISDPVVAGTPAGARLARDGSSLDSLRLLAWVVVLGTVWSGAALLLGFARLRRVASGAGEVEGQHWHRTLEEVKRALGLKSSVRLLKGDHPALVATWGWRRPAIVLPASATTWSPERIRIVLAHECAHIARRDWALQVSSEALRALFWFNPLLWLSCRRLRQESERACDDAVLAQGIPAAVYADHLVDIARHLPLARPSFLPALMMARPAGLEGRIVAMLNSSINRRPASWRARFVTAAALLPLTFSVAALHGQASFYSFDGTVRDQSDRVVPDTTLTLINTTSSAKYEIKSDGVGRFQFVGLPAASYKLIATRLGFANVDDVLTVTGNVTRDIHLKVGDLQETITVTDRTMPPSPADPALEQRRAAARRKFEEMSARARTKCASGADTLIGGTILPPAKLVDVRPIYPDHLKSAKVGGIVTMDAVIGTDGLVKEIDNVHGPDPALEQAAADAVRQWQFSATLLNCQAIDVNMHVTTSFKVEQ